MLEKGGENCEHAGQRTAIGVELPGQHVATWAKSSQGRAGDPARVGGPRNDTLPLSPGRNEHCLPQSRVGPFLVILPSSLRNRKNEGLLIREAGERELRSTGGGVCLDISKRGWLMGLELSLSGDYLLPCFGPYTLYCRMYS